MDVGKLVDKIDDASPASRHETIVPDNDEVLDPRPKALYVTVAGDVEIVDSEGTAIVYPDVPVGIFPFRPTKVGEQTTATVVRWDGN